MTTTNTTRPQFLVGDPLPMFLRAEEVCDLARCSLSTLNYWLAEGNPVGLPPHRLVGKHRLWKTEDVLRWLDPSAQSAA